MFVTPKTLQILKFGFIPGEDLQISRCNYLMPSQSTPTVIDGFEALYKFVRATYIELGSPEIPKTVHIALNRSIAVHGSIHIGTLPTSIVHID